MSDLKVKLIAVVGVSANQEKYGFKIFRDLLDQGFNIVGVNVNDGEVLGKKILRSLKEINQVPDLVITVIPPPATESIVDECVKLGVKEIWMQPGSESDKAIEKAKQSGINVTFNACFMVQQGIW